MPRLSPPPISRFGLTGGQPLAPYADLPVALPPPPRYNHRLPGWAMLDIVSREDALERAGFNKPFWGLTERLELPSLNLQPSNSNWGQDYPGGPEDPAKHQELTDRMVEMGEDALFPISSFVRGSLIGNTAKNWNQDVADLAKKLKADGETDDEIWKKTGDYLREENSPLAASVVEPKTGQVFTEYPDVGARFNPEGFTYGLNERLMEADDALTLKRLSDEMGNDQVNDMPVSEAVLEAFRQRYNREPSPGAWAASARASDELTDVALKEFNVPGPLSAKQGDVFDHPLMYEAYPEARDMTIKVVDRGPNTMGGTVSGWGEPPRMTLSPATAVNTSLDENSALGVLGHENTHAFPQGATVGAATGASPSRDLSMQWAESEADRLGIAADSPEQAEFLFEMWRRRLENPSQLDQDVYQKTVGEEQARAVQKRMLLPLEQLRQNPFHRSMDTPMAEQWVSRLSEGNAPQIGLPPPPKNLTPDEMRVWQGSPHKFDALDPTKIGTGEGAQAYGHGMYVAESRGVAQTYQPRDFDAEEIMLARYKEAESAGDYNRMEQWENAMMHDTPDDLRERSLDMDYDEDYRQAAAEVAEELADIPSASFLYEIDVPDEDIAKMLDWDAPLSEQPQSVKQVILDSPAGKQFEKQMNDAREAFGVDAAPDWMDDYTGQSFYRQLVELEANKVRALPGSRFQNIADSKNPAESASKYLNELGIPGIKYYDQGSRAADGGTRNMVLFDELARRAKVLKRNNETITK